MRKQVSMAKKSESILPRGFKTKAENLAVEYREKLSVHPCGPLPSRKLAEYLEVPVHCVSNIVEDENDLELIMGVEGMARFSAVHFKNADGTNIILHNGSHSPARQESNIMHELAHIICGHCVPKEYLDIPIAFGMRYFNEQQEEEAKFLGGCLQISRPGLLLSVKRGMSHQETAEYFNASIEMVKYRMQITGVEKQRFYRKAR
jgi:Zn-dependent peptidase ImmA (M78 family)